MRVRDALAPATLALDALWSFALVAIVVRAVSGGGGGAPSLAAIAAAGVGSFVVVRWIPQGLTAPRALGIAVAASVVTLFVILHTEYAATDPPWRLAWVVRLFTEPRELLGGRRYLVDGAIAVALLWLFGVARWSNPIESRDVLPTATLGFAAIALAAMIDPPTRGPHPFGIIALAYFVLAWFLLALYQTADADEPLRTFGARWGAAFGIIVVIAGLFVLALSAFDPDTLGFLGTPARALIKALGVVAMYTLGPIAAAVGWLFGLIPLHRPNPQEQMPQPPPPPNQEQHGDIPLWLRIVGYALAGGAVTTLALSFVGIVWLALRRRRRGERPTEQRHAVERDSTLAQDLGDLLDSMVRRFRRAGGASSSVSIRRLYHQMLARAEADGLPRPPAATPLAFAPHLDARYASRTPSAITSAFVRSRYGLAEIEPAMVSELREQWRSLLREESR